MFSNKKGQFKYLKTQPIRIGILTIILLFMCAAVFMIGFITKGTSKNIFTVVAVLGMLPVAKLIVSFIMCLKAEKNTCPKDIFDSVNEIIGNADLALGYDFYLTSYKLNFPLYSCFVYDGSLIALCADSKTDLKACKEHIEKYLKNNSIDGIKVYILDNKNIYFDRLKSVPSDYVKTEKDLTAYALIKNLSL